MSVFRHSNYREALAEELEIRQRTGRWTLRKLAEKSGVQPSFLTNVMKGRADFSSDQLYAVCECLEFPASERKYFLLLLEFERSSHQGRKRELETEIQRLQKQHLKSESHLQAAKVEVTLDMVAEYYLDPFVQLAHVHLNFPAYAKDPEKLRALMGISKSHLSQILDVLVRIGYIRHEGQTYHVITKNKHLPKESPLCGPHQSLMRLKSIDQMQRLAFDEKYSFSATFTGTQETKTRVQEAFLGFLKKAEAAVRPAESKAVFQMNFDLFPWQI